MKTKLAPWAVLAMLLSLTACNTIAGAGRDIQGAGSTIHDAARDCGDANGC